MLTVQLSAAENRSGLLVRVLRADNDKPIVQAVVRLRARRIGDRSLVKINPDAEATYFTPLDVKGQEKVIRFKEDILLADVKNANEGAVTRRDDDFVRTRLADRSLPAILATVPGTANNSVGFLGANLSWARPLEAGSAGLLTEYNDHDQRLQLTAGVSHTWEHGLTVAPTPSMAAASHKMRSAFITLRAFSRMA